MYKLVILFCAAALSACASPPKPPTVDGNDRTGVNGEETASMLSLRAEQLENRPVEVQPVPLPHSETITLHFPFNSARFKPTPAQEAALLPLLANARRIEVRGRTDAEHPSAGDARIAFLRAQAAMKYLAARGVPATNISVNYLSGGDHVAETDTALGRAQNRRVEIEVFYQ